MPQEPGKPTKLAVPNALQMGRRDSPGNCCSASETAQYVAAVFAGFSGTMRELAEYHLEKHIKMLPHPDAYEFDGTIPWVALEVFVDNFMAMCQDTLRLPQFTRSILYGIQEVFPLSATTGHTDGREPISVKKIKKGDADWTVEKELLGWLVDATTARCN